MSRYKIDADLTNHVGMLEACHYTTRLVSHACDGSLALYLERMLSDHGFLPVLDNGLTAARVLSQAQDNLIRAAREFDMARRAAIAAATCGTSKQGTAPLHPALESMPRALRDMRNALIGTYNASVHKPRDSHTVCATVFPHQVERIKADAVSRGLTCTEGRRYLSGLVQILIKHS